MDEGDIYMHIFAFFTAGIISLLDEEEPQLKVRNGCIVTDNIPEYEKGQYGKNVLSHYLKQCSRL